MERWFLTLRLQAGKGMLERPETAWRKMIYAQAENHRGGGAGARTAVGHQGAMLPRLSSASSGRLGKRCTCELKHEANKLKCLQAVLAPVGGRGLFKWPGVGVPFSFIPLIFQVFAPLAGEISPRRKGSEGAEGGHYSCLRRRDLLPTFQSESGCQGDKI